MSEKCKVQPNQNSPENTKPKFENNANFRTDVNILFGKIINTECSSDSIDDTSYTDYLLRAKTELCEVGIGSKLEKLQDDPEDIVDGLVEIMYRKFNPSEDLYTEEESGDIDGIYKETFTKVFCDTGNIPLALDSYRILFKEAEPYDREASFIDEGDYSLNIKSDVAEILDITEKVLAFNTNSIRTDCYLYGEQYYNTDEISAEKYCDTQQAIIKKVEANYKLSLFLDNLGKRKNHLDKIS